ncbi:MAG: hypothetical protein E6G90_13545 [Alphaproteobacteria bacterium]|nr:MAG: hypothetical protein E6G90_13545 [Alphaproteobacteria bacterium]
MMEILTVQVIAAILGWISISTADSLYHRERIGGFLHSLWVSISNTLICVPIIAWTSIVFLGDGLVSWVLVAAVLSLIFFWQYHNLLKIPPAQRIRRGPIPMPSSGKSMPPPSNIGR